MHQDWLRPTNNATAAACPAPMTRAALLSLRTAGTLDPNCTYVITDHVQNRLVAGTTITLRAVSTTELSENVEVNTTYDNEAWRGVYDIDRALVLELQDNRNNVARGANGTEVAAFDWGNTRYTNVLVDNSSLLVTYGLSGGAIQNVEIKAVSTVNLTGFTGSLNNFEVEIAANVNLTGANGSWRYGKVIENSTFVANGYTGGGDSYYFEISDASTVNLSNTATQVNFRTSDLHSMTVSAVGLSAATGALTFLGCTLWQSSVTKASGSGATTLTRLRMHGTSVVSHQSAAVLNITNMVVEDSSNITCTAGSLGNVNISAGVLAQSSTITHNGTANLTITRNTLWRNGAITTDAGSSTVCSFTDNQIETGSFLRVVGAVGGGAFTVSQSDLIAASFIYKRHTGALTVNSAHMHGSSGIDSTAGDRSYTFTRIVMNNVARFNLTGTGAVTDILNDFDMSRGSASLANSGAANSFSQVHIHGLSAALAVTGTTGGQVANRLKMLDGSVRFINTTANVGAVLLTAEDNGLIDFVGVTAAKTAQYLTVRNNSTITINNSTGGGTISTVYVTNGGSYVVSAAAASSSKVFVSQGIVAHNGGTINGCEKHMIGTLTTGAFNHSNIVHFAPVNTTLTAANTSRALYAGLAPGAYAAGGQLV